MMVPLLGPLQTVPVEAPLDRLQPIAALLPSGMGPTSASVLLISALPAHAVRCSVRVSCSTNFLLHEGMLVVCVARRFFRSITPPTCQTGQGTPLYRLGPSKQVLVAGAPIAPSWAL